MYSRLIDGHNNFEIAETFFNSVYCAVFKHRKIRDEYAFVFSPRVICPRGCQQGIPDLSAGGSRERLLENLLDDYAFNLPTKTCSAISITSSGDASDYLAPRFDLNEDNVEFQVLEHHFYRNKGAYIVGRSFRRGLHAFVLPILHNEDGAVYVDTVLFGSDKVSVLVQFYPVLLPGGCQHSIAVRAVPAATDARQTHLRNLQRHGLQQARQDLLPSLCVPSYAQYHDSSILRRVSRAW